MDILLGLLIFVICIVAFSIGFKFGYSIKHGELPVIVSKKAEVKEDEFSKGFKNILNYNGKSQEE